MSTSSQNLTAGLSRAMEAAAERELGPREIERLVMEMFDATRNPLLRYVSSLGMPVCEGEEIIQEAFLALFRHLQLGRPRENLRAWIFRVTHNLALKQRHMNRRLLLKHGPEPVVLDQQRDPSPSPEEQVFGKQRQQYLRAALAAMPERDQRCLRLRAEGLRYREIARVLGISLGAVSISLTRSLARLGRADGRCNGERQ